MAVSLRSAITWDEEHQQTRNTVARGSRWRGVTGGGAFSQVVACYAISPPSIGPRGEAAIRFVPTADTGKRGAGAPFTVHLECASVRLFNKENIEGKPTCRAPSLIIRADA
jgi:hypothetical protein